MKKVMTLLSIILLILCGCAGGHNGKIISGSDITPMATKTQTATEEAVETAEGTKLSGILLKIDSEQKTVLVRELEEENEIELIYNGGSDVRNKYDEVITMLQMPLGEIVDIRYDKKSMKLKKMTVSKKIFVTDNIDDFRADDKTDTITFGVGKYKYDEKLVALSNGEKIDPTQIISKDIVTVRGIDNKIYSVVVDKGHGYVTFTGYNQFVGGTVEFGRRFLYKVSENMMATIPEGEYKITMTGNGLTGSKTVTVARDQSVEVDFSEYRAEVEKNGTVVFEISPEDAVLYIDGTRTDYKEPVELEYGRHTIRITSGQYADYVTTLMVDGLYTKRTIRLDEDSTEPASSENKKEDNNDKTEGSTEGRTETATKPEEGTTAAREGSGKGNLIIETPIGADAYIDSVYVGKVPVTVNKAPGEHIITFYRSGYATKSYSIDVSYEDADQKLSFPEMNEE